MTDDDQTEAAGRTKAGRASPQGQRPRRGPRRATPDYLERAALFYLERYASSSENLRRVLRRKVERSARAHGTDREAGFAAVDALVARFARSGLVDDRRYAEGKAASLHRRGGSARAIRAALAAKGVPAEEIDAAMAALRDTAADPELAAACAFARRRRLGPWRRPEDRAEMWSKDLAALGRGGFGYETARRVLQAETPEELEAECDL